MTVYELVIKDLGLTSDTPFKDNIQRIIDSTEAVILRYLRRQELPEDLTEVLVNASVNYFLQKYPSYKSGVDTVQNNPKIASISDNGQSISYAPDDISQGAKNAGFDSILGQYYGVLVLYRRLW